MAFRARIAPPMHSSLRTGPALAATALVLALSGGNTFAFNEIFAKDMPVSRMTEEDLRIAGAALRKALDTGQDGQAHEWKNPKTSAGGTIVPTKAFERQGLPCRGVELATTAGGRTARSQWNMCKTAQGWKVAEGR